jgi:transposase-like zinc-binding protein
MTRPRGGERALNRGAGRQRVRGRSAPIYVGGPRTAFSMAYSASTSRRSCRRREHATLAKVWPLFVERELREFLSCGVLARGFAPFRCDECGHEMLVAFSCKGRGFCPYLGRKGSEPYRWRSQLRSCVYGRGWCGLELIQELAKYDREKPSLHSAPVSDLGPGDAEDDQLRRSGQIAHC